MTKRCERYAGRMLGVTASSLIAVASCVTTKPDNSGAVGNRKPNGEFRPGGATSRAACAVPCKEADAGQPMRVTEGVSKPVGIAVGPPPPSAVSPPAWARGHVRNALSDARGGNRNSGSARTLSAYDWTDEL